MNKSVILYIIGAFVFMLTGMSAKAAVYDGSRLWLPQPAEGEMRVMENELKTKLLELSERK